MWSATGTLAPYANTTTYNFSTPPCGYLYNKDYRHFSALFDLVRGMDVSFWQHSIVLKRALYAVCAYPFMAFWGFDYGGFIFNVCAYCIALVALSFFTQKRYGPYAGCAVLAVAATYPGAAYWVGMPFPYAIIIPACILIGIALHGYSAATTTLHAVMYGAIFGLAILFYDPLFPLCAVCIVLIGLIYKKRLLNIGYALATLALPLTLCNLTLDIYFDIPARNINTDQYFKIFYQLGELTASSLLFERLPEVALVAVHNFFASNFIVLPLGFLVLCVATIILPKSERQVLTSGLAVEYCWALSILLFFCLANIPPPLQESRFTLQGFHFARLYQPLFFSLICIIGKLGSAAQRHQGYRTLYGVTIVVIVLLQTLIVLGPWLDITLPWSELIYLHFYGHGNSGVMLEMLTRYGKFTYGMCR
jgi:hypothetical protein